MSTIYQTKAEALATEQRIRDIAKSAYLGIATTTTTPPATGAYWYKVDTAGTYTNFLSGGSPIVVTEADFYDGTKYYDVTIEVKDNVATKVNAAREYTDERIGKINTMQKIPIVVDNNGKSPLWLNKGKLGFADLTKETVPKVKASVGVGEFESKAVKIPIVADSNGKSPLWLNKGKLGFVGLDAATIAYLKKTLDFSTEEAKKENTTAAAFPLVSDGASLTQWRAKVAKIKAGVTQQVNLVLTGDSWTEYTPIPTQCAALLRSYLGLAGSGWININSSQLDGITISKSGSWSIYDLSPNPTYGCGIDGHSAISSTANSKINLGNLTNGDQLTIFYGNSGGTFSYSLNGGTAVEVVSATTDDNVKSVTISGLTSASTLVLNVVSGTVSIHGFHLRKTTGSGVEVNKCGNASATGEDYGRISPTYLQKYTSYLKPDVVVIMLGTNDYRVGKTVASYKEGITKMINAYRANDADCGIILVAPARTNGTATLPLSEFQNAIYELAIENKVEYYNMYDDWDTFANENTNGQWLDDLHVNNTGAYRIASKLLKSFLEI